MTKHTTEDANAATHPGFLKRHRRSISSSMGARENRKDNAICPSGSIGWIHTSVDIKNNCLSITFIYC
ncbi:MAG: hypothetical protein QXG94_02535 [Candidatus Bathyarchaeia archaeon]